MRFLHFGLYAGECFRDFWPRTGWSAALTGSPAMARATMPRLMKRLPHPVHFAHTVKVSVLFVKKILLVDDDDTLPQLVRVALEQEGFEVLTATDGVEGLRIAYRHHPDLVILDIMMPRVDGWKTCERLREMSDVPIIMLTAKTTEADVLRGLSLGADDYVMKPFSIAELVARVQACLRRAESGNSHVESTLLISGPLSIDLARRKVTMDGEPVDLTPTEFRLLSLLARNRGEVVPHRKLLAEVWGPEYVEEYDYLHLYVSYLRRKIEKDPSNPEFIKTAWGEGYHLE
jgi:DNA-binding response OmpR family regulator